MHFVAEALEKKVETLSHMVKCYADPSRRGLKIAFQETMIWRTDIKALTLAEPYYWSGKTVEIVNQLQGDFDLSQITCSRHLLHSDVAFHWFPERQPLRVEAVSAIPGFRPADFLDIHALTSY